MAGFVFSHLMNGVVDSVEILLFGAAGNAHLVGVGTGFGCHALFEVGLGVPDAFAKEFGEFCGVLGLFESIALEGLGDFGITFAVGLTRHSQIHADFAAFAVEMGCQVSDHFGIGAFGNTDFMLGDERKFFSLVEFFEFRSGSAADGALRK